MASVEDLTNNEIRTKLAEFGAPVGPVTETTRKVLLKKLKHLMVQRELSAVDGNSSKARKSFSRFSSGEDDSDDDVRTKKESTKMPPPSSSFRSTRRQTIAIPRASEVTSPVTKSRRSVQVAPTSPKPVVQEPEKTGRIGRYSSHVSTDRSSPSLKNVNTRRGTQRSSVSRAEEYDEGSDSDVTVSQTVTSRFKETKTLTVDKGEPNNVSSPSVLSRLSGFQSSYLGLSQQNGEDTNSDSATAVSDLLSFRKRYSSNEASPASPDTSYPYTSNFARRLTLARARKPGSSLSDSSPHTLELLKLRDPDIIKDDGLTPSTSFASSRENGHFFASQLDSSVPYTSKQRSHDIAEEFKTTEDVVAFWKNSQTVSMVLLAVAFVFFLGLGVVYMNVRAKDTTTFFAENERNVFPICPKDASVRVQPCILSTDLESATDLMKILHPRLLEQAVASECGPPLRDGSYVNPIMSESEALKFLSEQTGGAVSELTKHLHNLKLMLVKNPHWGVTVTSPYQPADGREQVEDTKVLVEHGGMRVNSPVLPLLCWLRKMLALALAAAAFIGGGLGVAYTIQKTIVWLNHRREKEKQEVYALVQQIIELLQSHHQSASSPGGIGTSKSFLAINHVRDQLIPPQDRSRMAGLWEKAVSFLENNESRVRHEVQMIAGEECPVWRWLPTSFSTPTPSPTGQKPPQRSSLPDSILEPFNPNRNKVWQGQAFETEVGSPNNLPCSPTPCLKLRHMFDLESEYGDDWPVKVQDAILEKCEGVNVLHIAVDKTSTEGCVYVKCTTQEEAGKAYRALHGWWFDSKLVTVKYIRLERYYSRFPDSRNAKYPLKPSNNKKLSLQANFWQSPLETN